MGVAADYFFNELSSIFISFSVWCAQTEILILALFSGTVGGLIAGASMPLLNNFSDIVMVSGLFPIMIGIIWV